MSSIIEDEADDPERQTVVRKVNSARMRLKCPKTHLCDREYQPFEMMAVRFDCAMGSSKYCGSGSSADELGDSVTNGGSPASRCASNHSRV